MAFQIKMEVWKITEMRDGAVYRTKKIGYVWVTMGEDADHKEIANQNGGDMLSPTYETRIKNDT